jgi:endonuclease/exonuclease/phosphatase family metal-dependent hydrolase
VRHDDAGDGDGPARLERVWIAHTDQHLFLRLTLGQTINLQEGNDLTLYLDTDNDTTTGTQALGIGAELQWTFGRRSGRLRGQTVGHTAIGLTSLPTVRSDAFEIALDRSAEFEGRTLFSGDSLRIGLSSGGDRLPDEDGGLGYVLSDTDAAANAPSIDGPGTADARLLSYNVLKGSIFDAGAQPSYRRIFDATVPDILALQEVSASAAETEQVMESDLGISDSWSWAKAGNDLVLGSHYSIQDTHVISGTENIPSGAFLLETQTSSTGEVIVVNMHPPCCNFEGDAGELSSNEKRQLVVDGVVAFLRDVKQGNGPFGVSSGTPIVVAGDMNFVGDSQQPRTLRTGEIQNTGRFGDPAAPDWDNSSLLDTNPRQTAAPLHTTWINPESSFPPGRLDYVYVTDSAVDVPHEFVLNTQQLSSTTLNDTGLRRNDTGAASDHLPLVVDLIFQ